MQQDGLVVVVKHDCPTCVMVAPVLAQLAEGTALEVYSQDDPEFPNQPGVFDDRELDASYRLDVEIVPTLVRFSGGQEVERTYGWDRAVWEKLSGVSGLGSDLPEARPGCGALNQEPARLTELKIRHGDAGITARRVPIGAQEDPIEACFERDWSDGLPVVPPTDERVFAMLQGSSRQPDEVLGEMPPNYGPCTVEKVAINAVMAGCKPEYMPVVLAAVEAALDRDFALHGVLASTRFTGPVIIVNGPIAKRIDMNGGINALGQGNRANATIGRALQLAIRNIGGGKPGGVDRATLGSPGKYTYCFCEDEAGSAWTPLTVDRGFDAGTNAVTVFAGYGLQGVVDERARTPEDIASVFASSLRAVDNINKFPAPDAILVVCPEHERTLATGGWDKARLHQELIERLTVPADSVMPGQNGIQEGAPASFAGKMICKFPPGALMIVRAGGSAGKFSGVIAGFTVSSPDYSRPVTKEIRT
ncbi:MAG: thioredoxin family protein [Alphaproteobacteria bacterium]|jgi:hypothetical protein|nr:thioredoxin family protein [Alphaproteobacteria bacterium]MDP6620784.1 thioredoxin family protein [Alphaproteobacteria bacterium]|tara:strand:- start:4291 stop:5718 length:1428 start_codon:yes stop_codon:yes gene_type:complete